MFDKLWALDITLGEFRALLDAQAEVIEETILDPPGLKELLLYVDSTDPLHVVVVVDDIHREERLVTLYRPDPDRWSADYRNRR